MILLIKKIKKKKKINNLSTTNVLLTNSNVTCVMQVMLVSHAGICMNTLMNTETLRLPLENIFVTSTV